MLWFDVIVHWLHLMAAAVWVGGMIFTGYVLMPVARKELPPPVRHPFFKAVGRRFAVLGNGALLILVATGTYKLSLIWGSDGFWSSLAGRVIIVKLGFVAAMLALTTLHNFVWGPRAVRLAARPDQPEYRAMTARLAFWSRVNVVLVVVIVFLGAFLRINPF